MSFETRRRLMIEGTLQGRVLVMLMEGPTSGVDLMKKLGLSSPGTIYPVLKALRSKDFIELAPETVSGKKLYVLSEKGKEQLKIILLGISRRFFTYYVEPYTTFFIKEFEELIPIKPGQRVLCTLDYKPIRQWLKKVDVTYLQLLEPPSGTYDLILCTMIGTLILYGWKKEEFTNYLSRIVKSLRPGGRIVMTEIEKTDNMFAEMFFIEVLGYRKFPGMLRGELFDLLEKNNLNLESFKNWKGLLISLSTKHK